MGYATDNSNRAGAIVGSGLVFGKNAIGSLQLFGTITWSSLIDASILAAAGAVVGFIVTAVCKALWKWFINKFFTKNSNTAQ